MWPGDATGNLVIRFPLCLKPDMRQGVEVCRYDMLVPEPVYFVIDHWPGFAISSHGFKRL